MPVLTVAECVSRSKALALDAAACTHPETVAHLLRLSELWLELGRHAEPADSDALTGTIVPIISGQKRGSRR